MRFRQHQAQARARTARLFACFALLLLGLVLAVNLLLALAFKLLFPVSHAWPALFFQTNTAVVLLFVLGGAWVETQRLRAGGGPRVARWLGGRELTEADNGLERRLLNVVDEMALASGQALPRVFVLHREDTINALVAGWGPSDAALCVTQGALTRLTRAELQALVAHEFGHIKAGDLPLAMRLLGLVWGLSLVRGYGQSLIARHDAEHAAPLSWLVGQVFAVVGWMGWMSGQALQAAVSRQREFLADAQAVQFTRSRDGLGQVLRKLWHAQEHREQPTVQHHAAWAMASMWVHQAPALRCLASHPRLPTRIRRVCGASLNPLPAPVIGLSVIEARRAPTPMPSASPAGAPHPTAPSSAFDTLSAPAWHDPLQKADTPAQDRLAQEREASLRLQRLSGPTERRMAVLALMIDPDNAAELKLWHRMAEGLMQAQAILDDVGRLRPSRRLPEFERLVDTLLKEPLEGRRTLVENARDLLRADGRVSPRERLWWLALRRRLSEAARNAPLMRPITGQGQQLDALADAERKPVMTLSAYLARFTPLPESKDGLSSASRAWLAGVCSRCGIPPEQANTLTPPDADGLVQALTAVQEMSWMLRPLLVKAWVEEAVNHSPQGVLSDTTADALRLMASLMGSPMPPMLDAHYTRR